MQETGGPREPRREMPSREAVGVSGLVQYAEGAVVSRVLARNAGGTMTAFAFDQGESVSEHTTPCAAVAHVVEGTAEFVIDGRTVRATGGDLVAIPAGAPHSVRAVERFKMLLVMLRG